MAEPDINPQLSINNAESAAFSPDHKIRPEETESLENGRVPSPKVVSDAKQNMAEPAEELHNTHKAAIQRPRLPELDSSLQSAFDDEHCADWLKSPKSPSSMFTSSKLPDSSGAIIAGILLCYWDNILGPKIRHLWASHLKDTANPLKSKTLNFVASHTLSGEICRDLLDPTVDSKFYVLQDKQVVVTSFVFGGMSKGDLAVHSLSVIIPHVELASYLHWHQLCVSHVTRLVTKLRILLEKVRVSLLENCQCEVSAMIVSHCECVF